MVGGLLSQLEDKLGLPKLTKVADSLQRFPDARSLKLIKDVLETAERVARTAPELDKLLDIIREINSMPMDKLVKLEKVLRRIEVIIKSAPQDLLGFITSLKEE